MQMTKFKNKLSLIICMVLIAAMALTTTACSNNKTNSNTEIETESQSQQEVFQKDGNVLGEGETEIFFTVTDGEGKETRFTIHTDKKNVGEALLELNLIAGEDSEYGLYIKTVNGITVDYDKDGKYWAFYVDGEYALAGVDTTDITEGATYSLKVEQ